MMPFQFAKFVTLALGICLVASSSWADNWPMYRGGAARQAYTAEAFEGPLHLQWTYRSQHAPLPAWPRSDRLPFDRAYHTVVADGRLFFGSSVDHKVYCLDAETGATLWTYFTDGPIRFAPAVWRDRVFVVSDDGWFYCLSAEDGTLVRRQRGGPADDRLLGNERLISRWPARGGPVVVGDVVYYAAGIWPSEGIFLYAIDAASGETLWVNDDSGDIYMPQPHGGAEARSGASAQGYLVANGDALLVPTGRAVPASFDRNSGKFQFFHLQQFGHRGGSPTMAVGDLFFNSGTAFDHATGQSVGNVGSGALSGIPGGLVRSTTGEVSAFRWIEVDKPDRKGIVQKVKALEPVWTVKGAPGGTAVVATAGCVVTADSHAVALVDAKHNEPVWSAEVEGTPYGLAVSDGRLFVSTDRGVIHCFGPRDGEAVVHEHRGKPNTLDPRYVEAAQDIVRQSGNSAGFCADIDCRDAQLAEALARTTDLQIYAVAESDDDVRVARERLDAAGLYGSRVTVHQGDPSATHYPEYFADVVVSDRSLEEAPAKDVSDEASRLSRPYGGIACWGAAGALKIDVRGDLPGAGDWTHQYADAGNSCCSIDTLVQGELGMLWFRDVDHDMPQRHGRGPAPLYYHGYLVVEGIDGLHCVDAYNGRSLWQYELPDILQPYNSDALMGTAGTGSNFCIADGHVFVRNGASCLKLDLATGKKVAEFATPQRTDGRPAVWGFIASAGGLLYGTLDNPDHVVKWRYQQGDMSKLLTESDAFFALDAATGELRWSYDARDSIRHNAITIGKELIYLIDRPIAIGDHIASSEDDAKQEQPKGVLLALDRTTGEERWRRTENVFGTLLAVSPENDALMMSYQPTRFRLDSEKSQGMAVFKASDGTSLWESDRPYASRPMINGRTIYAQGAAFDLMTGSPQSFEFSRSYGCGILAGCENMMFFRSATLGYYEFGTEPQTHNYGGMRPGCWINAIPAGGLVLVPDASAGCECSYLNTAWIALKPLAE
ncbi:MAG: PQQ-binding-like beta-propeller repeat protein [Planctomycetales bacterium]|nr:PQQ-binding-like beta-propeller repeat protein [Planctomycetales bacterium]